MVFFFRKGSEGSYGTDRVGDAIGPGWEPLKGTAKDMLSWSTLFPIIVSACKCKYTCLFVSVIIRSYLSFFYASIYIYIYIYMFVDENEESWYSLFPTEMECVDGIILKNINGFRCATSIKI